MAYESDREKVFQGLLDLHRDVDRQAGALAARHAARLQCGRGCADCCRDGLTVFAVAAERIVIRPRAIRTVSTCASVREPREIVKT